MDKLSSDEIKKISIRILEYVDDICRKNNIEYFIGFGTLIGAVRHKGFIPWDDDIDISMKRDDYNKFIQLMLMQNEYVFLSEETEPMYYFTFGRVSDKKTVLKLHGLQKIYNLGVFIDVFPIDVAPPENEQEAWLKEYNEKRKRITATIPLKVKYDDFSLLSLKRLFGRMPARIKYGVNSFDKNRADLHKHIIKYNNSNNSNNNKYIISGTPYGLKTVFDKSIFEKTVDMQFENIVVKAPVGWDEYLRQIYGNYMELPPVEKRVSLHHFTAYKK